MKLSNPLVQLFVGFVSFFVMFFGTISVNATPPDSTFKNTIRMEFVHPILLDGESNVVGYERLLKPNQSFSINVGRLSFAQFGGDLMSDDVKLNDKTSQFGFTTSMDYRYYLKSLNVYNAPRGVYIGPYYTYNHFNRENSWNLNSNTYQGDVKTLFKLNTHTIGFELGYQFLFWKRLSVDMVLIGPGLSFYSIKTDLNTSLSPEDERLLFEEINNKLSEKFPFYDRIIDGEGMSRSGTVNTTSWGYRYLVMIGYRF